MKTILIFISFAFSLCATATEYSIPSDYGRLIVENHIVTVKNDVRPLEEIAAKYKIGLLNMFEDNTATDPYLPDPSSRLTVPSQMLLPDTEKNAEASSLILLHYACIIIRPVRVNKTGL